MRSINLLDGDFFFSIINKCFIFNFHAKLIHQTHKVFYHVSSCSLRRSHRVSLQCNPHRMMASMQPCIQMTCTFDVFIITVHTLFVVIGLVIEYHVINF